MSGLGRMVEGRVWTVLMSLFLLCCSLEALAGGDAPLPESAEAEPVSEVPEYKLVDEAEYQRLAEEIERLSTRNAWSGVERNFVLLLATGADPTFDDWLRGAHAARALGDIRGARGRLLHAKELREDLEVFNWLYDIDSHYGDVYLACDAGSHITLQVAALPFDPLQRRAVEHAQAQIEEHCLFDGLLPFGSYQFYTHEIEVGPVQAVRYDLQGLEIDRKTRRDLEKAWKARRGVDEDGS